MTKKSDGPNRHEALPATGVMVTGYGIPMLPVMNKTALLAAMFAGLCACAGGRGDYPSLAMRPFETAPPPAEAPPPAPIREPVDPARLAAILGDAAAADSAFRAAADRAARLAPGAAGQPPESDARAAAIIALAELDTQRGKTAGALASLDALAAEAAGALSPAPALAAAQGDLAATLARQDEAIARLWRVMGS